MSDVDAYVKVLGAHEPADDWKCSCGEDMFGGTAAYSWLLFREHVATELSKVNRYRLAWANARARADAWKRLAKGDL